MSRPLTSSGSESLNSQPSPVQLMKDWQDLSVSSSRRNCHSWMGPLPEEQMGKEGTRGRRGRGRKNQNKNYSLRYSKTGNVELMVRGRLKLTSGTKRLLMHNSFIHYAFPPVCHVPCALFDSTVRVPHRWHHWFKIELPPGPGPRTSYQRREWREIHLWYNVSQRSSVMLHQSITDNGKKKVTCSTNSLAVVSELDSQKCTLILWFLCKRTNPSTFESPMLKSHLPLQHTPHHQKCSDDELMSLKKKTKPKCTLIQHKPRSGKQMCGLKTRTWLTGAGSSPVRSGEGARQQPLQLWKISGCLF